MFRKILTPASKKFAWIVSLALPILGYLLVLYVIGYAAKKYNRNAEDFFLGNRNMPWYLVGISMVATTFAADTPLLVAGIVAKDGISGNWLWWNFAFSGLLTAFFYGHLWKRSGLSTDAEFAEFRYGGKAGTLLRRFRALYLAVPINLLILGWVNLGMMKFIEAALGFPVWPTLLVLLGITTLQVLMGGLWGVVMADAIQFIVGMGGSIAVAIFAVQEVGGLESLSQKILAQPNGSSILAFAPLSTQGMALSLSVYFFIQWWASWYPGAEPGGGGYVIQRVLAAKTESDAKKSLLLFNFMHYVVRPWPWILTGLCSLVLFPNIADKEMGFPAIVKSMADTGLLGLISIAFFSAYMSTVSTHLNWGASYLVFDVYLPLKKKFSKGNSLAQTSSPLQNISGSQSSLFISRVFTVLLLIGSLLITLVFDTIKDAWEILLMIGAGTGPVYLARWYWWRINAYSEISAMAAAFLFSIVILYLKSDLENAFAVGMISTTLFTSLVWLVTTFKTPPVSEEKLMHFYKRVRPGGPGWRPYEKSGTKRTSLLYSSILWLFSSALLYTMLYLLWYVFVGRFM